MSPDERATWERLLGNRVVPGKVIHTLLDRMEQLERELAAARAALSESRDAGRKVHMELMAARAAPRHCGKVIVDVNGHHRCLGCGDAWREETPCKTT